VVCPDIPVRINWEVLDDAMLTRFWQRQAALHNRQTSSGSSGAAAAAAAAAVQGLSSSSSPIFKSVLAFPELLNRGQLPDFADRMLVFHRWVGGWVGQGLGFRVPQVGGWVGQIGPR
jgi:hypothetical protein